MADRRHEQVEFRVQTENGPRRLFWVKESKREELVFFPRTALGVYPASATVSDFEKLPDRLVERKFTFHLPKPNAHYSCVTITSTLETISDATIEREEKKLIPAPNLFRFQGHFVLYAYICGTLNNERHLAKDSVGEHIVVGEFDQNHSTLLFMVIVSANDYPFVPPFIDSSPLPYSLHTKAFTHFRLTTLSSYLAFPAFPFAYAYLPPFVDQEQFRALEFGEKVFELAPKSDVQIEQFFVEQANELTFRLALSPFRLDVERPLPGKLHKNPLDAVKSLGRRKPVHNN